MKRPPFSSRRPLQIDPKFAEAHYQLGYARPARALARGLQEMSDRGGTRSQSIEGARCARATLMLLARKYTEAEEQARYVAEHDPNNAEGFLLLGNTLFGEKRQPEALEQYSKVIAMKPNEIGAYLNRGVLYGAMKQDDLAEQDFRKAISLDPHSLQGYANLAGLLLYKSDPKKAEDMLRSAIQNNPDRQCLICVWPALMLRDGQQGGRRRRGPAVARQATQFPEVAAAIGDYYLASRNPEAAIKEYKRGMDFAPGIADLQVRLLETLLNTGKIDEAQA